MTDAQRQNDPTPEIDAEAAAQRLAADLAEALARIQALEAELAEARDARLRALAEVENVIRRAQRDREETAKFSLAGAARDMVQVHDNLARAVAATPPDARAGDKFLEALAAGVEATERELIRALDKIGVSRIEAQGQIFDPHKHEVMFEMDGGEALPGTILQVVESGWMIHDRLLRPARVGVARRQPAGQKIIDQNA